MFFNKRKNDPDISLLCTLNDPFRIEILLGVLDENKIPDLRHELGGGSAAKLFTGVSFFGSEIYVAAAHLPRAQELLQAMQETFDQSIETTDADVAAAAAETSPAFDNADTQE